MRARFLSPLFTLLFSVACIAQAAEPIDIGSRLELFVDDYLIDTLEGAELQLHHPQSGGVALRLDRPWEGELCGYFTVLSDQGKYKMYYRGRPLTGYGDATPEAKEMTCYAESADGKAWNRPRLGIHAVAGSKDNNIVLMDVGPLTHNFAPFVDQCPGVPASERYKGVGGTSETGLVAFVSPEGIQWRKLRDEPIITGGAFDSQNNVFWSDHEQCYVCFYRTFRNGVRWITRTTSKDFLHWSEPEDMSFGNAPHEHLYTNQTEPYNRAPHIYVGLAARFWPERQTLSEAQVRGIDLESPKNYAGLKTGCSDSVLLTSRGGTHFDRVFLESLDRPGLDLRNWTARSNYPARGIIQTGPAEMSMFVQRHYGQPSAYVERMTFRLDGFASVHAPYKGGQLVTKTLVFAGIQLLVNLATSAAGSLRVEIQDAAGQPLHGFSLAESQEMVGDEIDCAVVWNSGADVRQLSGTPVRLRFELRDADLYSIRFLKPKP